jgi:hypothetical protein
LLRKYLASSFFVAKVKKIEEGKRQVAKVNI